MKRVTAVLISLALLVSLAACGGGTDGAGASNGGPSGGGSPGGGTVPPAATAPSITTQPFAQSVTAPDPATFSVVASGTAPLAYQWRSSTDGTSWNDIVGATGASYATGATEVGMNGRYYSVVVSNSAGSVASSSVRLTAIAATSPPAGGGGPGDGGSGGGGGSGSGGTGGGPTGPSGEFPHTANPIAAAVTLASAAAANFDVSSSSDATVQIPGGASDIVVGGGVMVSLGFPGDTFLEDQSLAVTPATLADLDSGHPLPFQSVLGAFVLNPSDPALPELRTNNLVRVTFTLSQQALDTLGARPVIFSARADGTELHIAPVFANADGSWSTLSLTTNAYHLGIFGIATVNDAQAATLAAAWPSYDDLQLEAAIAPASYERREAILTRQATGSLTFRVLRLGGAVKTAESSSEDEWFAQMRARLDAYYNDEVIPALNAANAANADIAQFQEATQKLITWERMRQLLDLEDDRDVSISQQLIDLANRGLQKAMQDCSANRNAGAAAQALGLARELALFGVETDITLESVMDACGRSTYDVSVDWTQIHNLDYTIKPDADADHAFTRRLLEYTKTSGKLHLSGTTPQISSVSLELTSSNETTCESGAYLCTPEKYSIIANDSAPAVSQCGAYGFYGSYRIDRWNLDARGHYAKPNLYVTFQNATGCARASMAVASGLGTRTNYDQNGNVSSTTSSSAGEEIDTVPWSGGVSVGSSSRIVRRTSPSTGPGVQPGSEERWTTTLTFTITEVIPPN